MPTNNVSIIGFHSKAPNLPRPHLAVAVANRLKVSNGQAVRSLQAACPVEPLRVPCMDLESPAALWALLRSLGAVLLPVD